MSLQLNPALLDEFLPMVRYWARYYSRRGGQVLDVDDLVVVGLMGLMNAASRFDQNHSTMFKTYAEFRIRGEILDELRRQDWMTRSERRKQKLFRQAEKRLGQKLGRNPTRTELAKVLPFKPRELDRMLEYEAADTIRPYEEGDRPHDDIPEEQDTVAGQVERQNEVQDLLTLLSPLHRQILRRRYYDDASLNEIASEVGLSEGRVSQLHSEALTRLRNGKRAA